MRSWRIEPARRALRGAVRVPGDKSIGHRALLLSALAEGPSTLRGLSRGADLAQTRRAIEALGVTVLPVDEQTLAVHGVGLTGLRAPTGPLDCGNSGTTMRLLAGLLVGQHFDSVLTGDASLVTRPMARVTRPLRARGGRIDGEIDARRNDEVAPLSIRAIPKGARLNELEWRPEVASAQVKSAILLSGLYAAGPTLVQEETLTRDHTERMLAAMGVPVQSMGPVVVLDREGFSGALSPLELTVPGDPSSAAFLLVAAHAVPGSRLLVKRVCANPTRTGVLDVLRDMGGGVLAQPQGDEGGEPVADLHVGAYEPAELRQPARVGGELAVRCIDEVPALVVAAALCARGVSEFRDLRELRVKESDRIEALAAMLRAFGREVSVLDDGLRVPGGGALRGGAVVDSFGDHRVAMSAAILALRAEGATVVRDTACVDTSFPEFVSVLARLGAEVTVLDEVHS